MALIHVSLLLIIAAFARAHYDCDTEVYRNCYDRDAPRSFPENEEELDAVCRSIVRYAECGLGVMEDCKNSEEGARQINNILSVVRNVCDEDSHIHRVVADNLRCLKPIFKRLSHECTPADLNEGRLEKHVNILSDQGFEAFAELEPDRYICALNLYHVACLGVKIENECGSSALSAYIEILRQSSPSIECNEEIKEYIPAYIDILKLEEAEAEEITEASRRKKK